MWETITGVIATMSFAVLGWAVSLTNRVSVLESRDKDFVTLIESKFTEVNRRLDRIEKAMNGKLNHD